MILVISEFTTSLNWRNLLLVLISLPCLATVSYAQNPKFITGSTQYGFIIPHSKELINVSNSNPKGFEATFGWHLPATASGIVSRRGFKISIVDFNYPNVLGYSINSACFAEPLWASHRRVSLSFPIEFGLSYNSKVYDQIKNPTNLFFSQPINFYLSAGARINWRVRSNFLIQLGGHYQHISNGGVKQPNKGMNFPMASLGILYYLETPSWEKPSIKSIGTNHKGLTMNFMLLGSIKTIAMPDEKTYIKGYQYTIVKHLNQLHGLVAGLEGVWNGYKKVAYLRQGEKVVAYEQSLQLGYQMTLSKTSFQVLAGVDLFNENRTTDLIYQRYGLYYQILSYLKVGGTIKAHKNVADAIDIRIGYTFNKR